MKHTFFLLISISIFSQSKINGVSFVASNRVIQQKYINPVIKVNANWVTLMPFAFVKTINDTSILFDDNRQWWGERKIGIEKSAELFKANNFKIMLKPQIWIPNGFTGNIKMETEKDWLIFEKNYEKFILDYAKIAASTNCEILCIGTELNDFVTNRTIFWNQLLKKIRNVYSGKITYAENWDTFEKVPFISEIDFIGIDAYFPLTNEKTPTLKRLAKAWIPVKSRIEKLSKKYDKKVIFTEYGYQSKDFTANEPWEHSEKQNVNLLAQQNSLAILLASFWNESWFEGGFLWKWYDNHNQVGGNSDSDYTVQNKSSELLLGNFYKKYQ